MVIHAMDSFLRLGGTLGGMEKREAGAFNDRRLERRLDWLRERMGRNPGVGFPQMVDTDSDLEAVYRFLRNPRVTDRAILDDHTGAVREKVVSEPQILVAHDTTEFSFGGESKRSGLGRLRAGGQGFFAHFSLAMRADGSRRPLGVLALQTQFRHAPARRLSNKESRANPQRRTFKWGIGVSAVEEVLDGATSAIHLMDREADAYEVLAGLGQKGHRFVVRVRQERLVRGENGKSKLLLDALEGVSSVLVREVPLTARSPKRINPKHCHPPRRERLASLHFRARAVILPRPPYGDPANKALPATLAVNIVHVFEPTPPSGEPPIEWLLATSEPVDTVEQVERVVDWYRARWVIEEYFKVLKTGCAYEKRQLESSHALVNALAVMVPVAVELLTLRTDARQTPDAAASTILSSTQIDVLRVMQRRHPLPPKPTVRDALLAIAALGGHLKNNGDPGWQTLWRGFEKLLIADAAWSAALLTRSDQS
jgi:hypothetical protein